MKKEHSLINGPIYKNLICFALPVIFALFLQSLYGAVDLLVVGHFATTSDVSGVSTGSQIMMTVTYMVASLAMGVTVLVGHKIGEKKPEEAGKAIGSAICLFSVITIIFMLFLIPGSGIVAKIMQAPAEAFDKTSSYVRICGCGFIFISAYNLIGCIFRGIGDSKTPLITVAISCVLNILGDILLVKYFNMGAEGAAWATVISQAVSVVVSLFFIRNKDVGFRMSKKDICWNRKIIRQELKIGIPIALQDVLVGFSFMVILATVNRLGVVASAGMGVGEKVCAFIMLIPSAFSQSMTAFVAQNVGAGYHKRSKKALLYGILTSFAFGLVMFYLSFFKGNVLASLFSEDPLVTAAAHSYLKAYAIDCLLTPIMFCMVGYFNGYDKTKFVMIQGILSAFFIRTPWAIFMGRMPNTSLFKIGLGTPLSTFTQIIMCIWMFRKMKRELDPDIRYEDIISNFMAQ